MCIRVMYITVCINGVCNYALIVRALIIEYNNYYCLQYVH